MKEQLFFYSDKEINEYDKYIVQKYGNYEGVFYDNISDDVRVDVIVIPPNKKENYYKLITRGMGSYKMDIPFQVDKKEIERAELVIFLPPNWNINSKDKKDFWPIEEMLNIAKMPVYYNSWIASGHSIITDKNYRPYAQNTDFCCLLLLEALDTKGHKMELKLNRKDKINFYQLFPLYKEELDYKSNNNVQKLLSLFHSNDLSFIVNINRHNYGKNSN